MKGTREEEERTKSTFGNLKLAEEEASDDCVLVGKCSRN